LRPRYDTAGPPPSSDRGSAADPARHCRRGEHEEDHQGRLCVTDPCPQRRSADVGGPAAGERDTPPDEQPAVDPFAALEDAVRKQLDAGAASLRDVTAQVTGELPEEERFRAAGRVAQVVARLARTRADRERPWLAVDEAFAIEEWMLPPKESAGRRD